jgi:hypothetical protein
VLVAADTHTRASRGSRRRTGSVSAVCFDVPNNPSFLAGALGVFGSTQVPIFYDNNRNGTFEVGTTFHSTSGS